MASAGLYRPLYRNASHCARRAFGVAGLAGSTAAVGLVAVPVRSRAERLRSAATVTVRPDGRLVTRRAVALAKEPPVGGLTSRTAGWHRSPAASRSRIAGPSGPACPDPTPAASAEGAAPAQRRRISVLGVEGAEPPASPM